jgi:hypothetical protein
MTLLPLVLWCVQASSAAPQRSVAFLTADVEAQVAAAREARSLCGPVSVWFCLKGARRNVRLETVVERAEMEADGMRMDALVRLAKAFELG